MLPKIKKFIKNNKLCKVIDTGIPVYNELSDDKVDMAIDLLIKELADNNYVICGDTHQMSYIPVFNDNEYLMLSQRRWGEIMAEVMNLKMHIKEYTYLDFYLASYCSIDEILPNKE